MKEIYKNNYGTSFLIENHLNPKYVLQLVINNLGIFMTMEEMNSLLKVVRSSYKKLENCNCKNCRAKALDKLWKVNPLFEVCLKVDNNILGLLEDLIVGTQFVLNIDEVLEKNEIYK